MDILPIPMNEPFLVFSEKATSYVNLLTSHMANVIWNEQVTMNNDSSNVPSEKALLLLL